MVCPQLPGADLSAQASPSTYKGSLIIRLVGQGGPALPLVCPQLPGAGLPAQAPQAITSQIPFHLRSKFIFNHPFKVL